MIPTLAVLLPDLLSLVHDLRHSVLAGRIASNRTFDAECDRFFTADTMDHIESVVPGWRAMASFGDGVTLRHTARAMAAMLDLPEYQAASRHDQNLMEWTVLLHDIAKEPRPGKRDHRHAFRSAARAGIVLPRVGFPVLDAHTAGFDDWYQLTDAAYRFETELGTAVQDSRKLPKIMSGIDGLFDRDAALVIKAIALHLSVTVVSEWPVPVALSPAEESEYIDAELLPVLAVMLLADSGGWELFNPDVLEAMYDETRAVVHRLGDS